MPSIVKLSTTALVLLAAAGGACCSAAADAAGEAPPASLETELRAHRDALRKRSDNAKGTGLDGPNAPRSPLTGLHGTEGEAVGNQKEKENEGGKKISAGRRFYAAGDSDGVDRDAKGSAGRRARKWNKDGGDRQFKDHHLLGRQHHHRAAGEAATKGFHPKPSKRFEERMAAFEERRRRASASASASLIGEARQDDPLSLLGGGGKDRRNIMDELRARRKAFQKADGDAAADGGANNGGADAAAKETADNANAAPPPPREELITDPGQKAALAQRYAEQQRRRLAREAGESDRIGTTPADHHVLGHLLIDHENNAPSAATDDTAAVEAHGQARNRLRSHLFASHPRNVQPTAPNFGLRYRTTHLATMSFTATEAYEAEVEEDVNESVADATPTTAAPSDANSGSAVEKKKKRVVVRTRERFLGNVTMALFGRSVPKTVANFVGLCSGLRGGASYVNSTIHRILDGFVIQGGDIEFSEDGEGGHAFDAEEEDENGEEGTGAKAADAAEEDDAAEMKAVLAAADGRFRSESRSIGLDNPSDVAGKALGKKNKPQKEKKKKKNYSPSESLSHSSSISKMKKRYLKHENYLVPHGAGTVSMAAAHRSKVGSQFYFALDDRQSRHLNRRFVVFGHVLFGFSDTLAAMSAFRVDKDYVPLRQITISGCEAAPYDLDAELALMEEGRRARKVRMIRDDIYAAEEERIGVEEEAANNAKIESADAEANKEGTKGNEKQKKELSAAAQRKKDHVAELKRLRSPETRGVAGAGGGKGRISESHKEVERLIAEDERRRSQSIAVGPEAAGISEAVRSRARQHVAEEEALAKGPLPREALMRSRISRRIGAGGRGRDGRGDVEELMLKDLKPPPASAGGPFGGRGRNGRFGDDAEAAAAADPLGLEAHPSLKAARADRVRQMREEMRRQREERARAREQQKGRNGDQK